MDESFSVLDSSMIGKSTDWWLRVGSVAGITTIGLVGACMIADNNWLGGFVVGLVLSCTRMSSSFVGTVFRCTEDWLLLVLELLLSDRLLSE
jgi:hypothetical protein